MRSLKWMVPAGMVLNAMLYFVGRLWFPSIWSFGVVFLIDSAFAVAWVVSKGK